MFIGLGIGSCQKANLLISAKTFKDNSRTKY